MNEARLALGMLTREVAYGSYRWSDPRDARDARGRAWEMGLKAAAHEQRDGGLVYWHGMNIRCVCWEFVTCGVRVATPTLALCELWVSCERTPEPCDLGAK